jgi:hypothetical protein
MKQVDNSFTAKRSQSTIILALIIHEVFRVKEWATCCEHATVANNSRALYACQSSPPCNHHCFFLADFLPKASFAASWVKRLLAGLLAASLLASKKGQSRGPFLGSVVPDSQRHERVFVSAEIIPQSPIVGQFP